MPRIPTWQAQHAKCRAAVEAVKTRYEAMLQKRIILTCSDCGDDFTETIKTLAVLPREEILAPALCVGCGHGAEDAG